eukprot:08054_5
MKKNLSLTTTRRLLCERLSIQNEMVTSSGVLNKRARLSSAGIKWLCGNLLLLKKNSMKRELVSLQPSKKQNPQPAAVYRAVGFGGEVQAVQLCQPVRWPSSSKSIKSQLRLQNHGQRGRSSSLRCK